MEKYTVIATAANELPFGDCLFNVVVHDEYAASQSYNGRYVSEVPRLLRPYGGISLTGNELVRKGGVSGAGEWSHPYCCPDRNPNSFDPYTRDKYYLSWFGRPGPQRAMDRHTRGMMPLWKNGLMVIAGNHCVTAVDPYNGTVLWEKDVSLSTRVPHPFVTGHMVLEDDFLYVLSGSSCLAFLPREGVEQMTFTIPSSISGTNDRWGYLASYDNVLVGSVVKRIPSVVQGWSSWAEKAVHGRHEYFLQEVSHSLFALNRLDDKDMPLWTYVPDSGCIVNPTIVVADSKVMFVESTNPLTLQADTFMLNLPFLLGNRNSKIVALDIKNGTKIWERRVDLSEIQFSCVMLFSDNKLFIQGTCAGIEDTSWGKMAYRTYAYDVQGGDSLWVVVIKDGITKDGHGAGLRHPAVVAGSYYTKDLNGFVDVNTGIVTTCKEATPGRCGTFTASLSHLFGRVDRHSVVKINPDKTLARYIELTGNARPSCWSNMIPAGGILNMPDGQHGCSCSGFRIQTSMAFFPLDTAFSTSYENASVEHDLNIASTIMSSPNPFNAEAKLIFSIPPQPLDIDYELSIYNIAGKKIITLANGKVGRAGVTKKAVIWNGRDARRLITSSGVYYYKLKYGSKAIVKSLTMLR